MCSQNKGTDQLCSHRAADLRHFFAYAKIRFSHDTAHAHIIYKEVSWPVVANLLFSPLSILKNHV